MPTHGAYLVNGGEEVNIKDLEILTYLIFGLDHLLLSPLESIAQKYLKEKKSTSFPLR